jgi:putative polyhydroxyalkanoate system protein
MNPVVVNLSHTLGRAEAHSRIASGVGRLTGFIPGGASVKSEWQGDRLNLSIVAMGQQVTGHIDVEDKNVRIEVMLPALLGMFAGTISEFLSRQGGELLEDKRQS